MPTDISPTWSRDARNFALRAVAWSLGLFGLLRWPWIQPHAILPVTQAQARVATGLFGAPTRSRSAWPRSLPIRRAGECDSPGAAPDSR